MELQSFKIVDVSPVAELPLTKLHLRDVQVADLSSLGRIGTLWYLQCGDSLPLKTLAGVESLKLTNLQIFGTNVDDPSPIRGMRLTRSVNGGSK